MAKSTQIYLVIGLLTVCVGGFALPEGQRQIPVVGATFKDWNPISFWYYPWGRSVVHKGIDIFAPEGTPVIAATSGLVAYAGNAELGGHVVLMLGSKWRLYYYAHLQALATAMGRWHNAGDVIGTVGTSGNAQGKPPHLHFSIRILFPQLKQYDSKLPQAWKKMFYIDPHLFLTSSD